MDIEWAKDGDSGEVFIVQARPETVQSLKLGHSLMTYTSRARARPCSPAAVSARRWPPARYASSQRRRHRPFRGQRHPRHGNDRPRLGADHEARRGHHHRPRRAHLPRRHCQPRAGPAGHRRHRQRHAVLKTGQKVTVSCAEGDQGYVYEGSPTSRPRRPAWRPSPRPAPR